MAPGEEQELLPEEPEAVESVAGGEAGTTAAGEAATAGEAAATEGAAPAGGATEGAAPAGEATDGAATAPLADEPPLGAAAWEPEAEPLGEPLDDGLPEAPHLGPVAGARSDATPSCSTDVPGSGNWTSLESGVVQSDTGIFAMNIEGNEAVSLPERSGMAKSVSLK